MEQTEEVKLAYEIARALNDLHSIDWHIGVCRRYDAAFLRKQAQYVLSRKDIDNPAGYYTKVIKSYDKHPRH